MKQILLDNAYESWKNAITYHNKIENGFSSLENQKGFVSSLHNAVELFLKQIMLNGGDHGVAWVASVKTRNNAQLQLNYLDATDLNSFFLNLPINDLNMFKSIEFNELIGKASKLLDVEKNINNDLKSAMDVLNKLRNNETHFYISESDFLNESNFCKLHNFMIAFYNSIVSKIFNSHTIIDFSNPQKYNLVSQYKIMEILFNPIDSFSYREALKSNKTVRKLKEYLSGKHSAEYADYGIDDHFLFAIKIMETEGVDKTRVDEYITLVGLMIKYKLFWIEKNEEQIELENGEHHVSREYSIEFDPSF